MPLTEIEKAYAAGIIDGEGCVSLSRRKKYLTPTVQVKNTRFDLLQWMKTRWGGSIYINHESRTNRKPCGVWSVAGQKAINVLRDVQLYLIVKAEQAKVVLALPRWYTSERDALGRIKGTLTPERLQENERLVADIRRLNRRGIHAVN